MMSKEDIKVFTEKYSIERVRYPVSVVVTWSLALAFGVAFWTLLLPNITPAIIRLIQLV